MSERAASPEIRGGFALRSDTLCAERVPLASIARRFGTPTYVYCASAIEDRYVELAQALAGLDATICYAMKANSNRAVVALLARAGAGADIVSGGELDRAIRAGVSPGKIVFSGVGKTDSEIREALRARIRSIHVESEQELARIDRIARETGGVARIAIRVNPNVDARTHPYIATGLKENKFGIPERDVERIARASRRLRGVSLAGLSIHIGSQLVDLAPLEDAFGKLRSLAERLGGIEDLDLGGGLGVRYGRERAPTAREYARAIRRVFGEGPWRLFLEPGRFLVAEAGALLARVVLVKGRFVVIDAAMNDLLRPALYGARHPIWPVRPSVASRGGARRFDLVGPVCESADVFARGLRLPATPKEGDLLAIGCAGAYGFSMASQYNSRPRPAEVLVRGSRAILAREREKLSDLWRGERLLGDARRRTKDKEHAAHSTLTS